MEVKKILYALKKIRDIENERKEKRKFNQTLDLIINLKDFNIKKNSFNAFVYIPAKFKNKKIAAFLEKDSKLIDVIKKDDFVKFKDKKDIKKLLNKYDNFIASAKLMPSIATTFGRVLGPAGKMPNPQLGILTSEDDKSINSVIEKINSTIKIAVKEPTIKLAVGKESLNDDEIAMNIISVYTKILENLPKGKDNIRNVKIKFTMSAPLNIEL